VVAQLENQDVTAVMERARAGVDSAKAAVTEAYARHKEMLARVEQARAELRDAERARIRTDEMIGKKYVSPETNDAAIARHEKAIAGIASAEAGVAAASAAVAVAESEVNAAEAAYEEAKVAVEYTYIRAPFDGVILSKHADIGDVVAPFATSAQSKGSVVSMADLSTLQVETDVSESNLTMVKVGQPCEIQLDALPDARLRGEVHMIVPTVDRTKATVMVKIRFVDMDERILPDMSARVAFLNRALVDDDKIPRIVAPPSAIITRDGQSFVFRIENDVIHEVNVITEGKIGEMTIIKTGLNSGDKVVVNPSDKLKDGIQIKPASG
jgi:RND family efflux transporter MFP subunit